MVDTGPTTPKVTKLAYNQDSKHRTLSQLGNAQAVLPDKQKA